MFLSAYYRTPTANLKKTTSVLSVITIDQTRQAVFTTFPNSEKRVGDDTQRSFLTNSMTVLEIE